MLKKSILLLFLGMLHIQFNINFLSAKTNEGIEVLENEIKKPKKSSVPFPISSITKFFRLHKKAFLACPGVNFDKIRKRDYVKFLFPASILYFNYFLLTFIHEFFGHYLFAKCLGYHGSEVRVGLGPKLFSKTFAGGMEFNVGCIFPVGYVLVWTPDGWKSLIMYSAGIITNVFTGLMAKLFLQKFGKRIKRKFPLLHVAINHFAYASILGGLSMLVPIKFSNSIKTDGYQMIDSFLKMLS